MVEVICDTNFLIHLATKRIKNIDNLDVEIGSISFVVPKVAINELSKLQNIPEKKQDSTRAQSPGISLQVMNHPLQLVYKAVTSRLQETLKLKPWPNVIKIVLRRTYINPFFQKQIIEEINAIKRIIKE